MIQQSVTISAANSKIAEGAVAFLGRWTGNA